MIQSSKLNSQRLIIAVVLLITALGLYFRFDRLNRRDLWGDELTFHNMRWNGTTRTWDKPLPEVLLDNLKIKQFPGDILLLWPFYRVFGLNKWALAFPRILLTILGFYLLYRAGKQYFKTVWGYLIAFLIFSFNNNLIFHAFEIRPYGILVTLSLASFLMMKSVVEDEVPSLLKRIGISAFIWLTLLFHFYGSFILLFNYSFHLVAARGRFRGKIILRNVKDYGFGVLLALPLWLYFTFGFSSSYMNWDPYEYIPQGVISLFKGVVGNLIGFKPAYVFLPAMIVPFIVPYEERWQQIQFFLIFVVIPVGIIFAVSVIAHYYFIQRLFVWVMPLFVILLGWVWDSLIIYLTEKFSPAIKPSR